MQPSSSRICYLPAMKFFFTLLLLASFSAIKAQKTIPLEDIANYVGDSVMVTGKVYTTRYLESASNAPTLINLGAAFPNQLVTVVIFGDSRKNFQEAPESFFKDSTVKVTGKVCLFKGKPQIVVVESSQMQIQEEAK